MDISIDEYEGLDEFYVQALLLAEVVRRVLELKAYVRFTSKPTFEIKPVSEFMKRMRITSLSKFDTATYISSVNFYASEEDIDNNNCIGVIIIYIEAENLIWLLKKMGYPEFDDDDQEALEDGCGAICNLIAAKFKDGLTQIGYKDLEMSHFSSFKNEAVNGVEFCVDKKEKYEISFNFKGGTKIIADLNMGSVPKEEIY